MANTPTAGSRARGFAVNALCVVVSLVGLAFIVPAAFGLERYVIAGGSMSGSIDLGSVAFEEIVPTGELRVGDVITYVPPVESGVDTLVTHRIVSIDGNELRTKGDANADADPWTFRLTGATQPRVVFSVPYVGFALLALQDRGSRVLAIGLPAAVIFLVALAELVRSLRRRPEPDESTAPAVEVQGPITAIKVLVPAQPGADLVGTQRVAVRRAAREQARAEARVEARTSR